MSRLPQIPFGVPRLARGAAVTLALSGGLVLSAAPPASASQKCRNTKARIIVCINQHGNGTKEGFVAVATFRNLNKGSMRIRPTLTDGNEGGKSAWAYKGGAGLTIPGRKSQTIRVVHKEVTQTCSGFYLLAGGADGWGVALFGKICHGFSEGMY